MVLIRRGHGGRVVDNTNSSYDYSLFYIVCLSAYFHPPILFLGFTALTIPFAFAIAALIKNKYDLYLKINSN